MRDAKFQNSKFYNINKATALITVEKTYGTKYGENPDDDWTETLYVKATGEYFVYGQGGKNSPYSIEKDGETVAGSRYDVWPDYNLNRAKNWIHSNCPEKMEELLMPKEESKQSVTSFVLSAKAKTNLKRKAKEENITVSELVRRWAETLY